MASIYDKASLVLIPSGTKTSKVYSQVPTNGDGDFTFSRSTAATRVNASGNIEKETQNLLLHSNNFGTTWGNTNITITGGQSDRDGGSNAWKFDINGGTAAQNVRQGVSNSGVTTFSLYLKAGTLNWSLVQVLDGGSNPAVYFDLQNGAVGNITGGAIDASIEAAGNGYYRCSIQANGNITQARIYPATADNNITQSSGYIFGQDAQVEQGLVARDYIETTTTAIYGGITDNVPRLDYTDSSCPALLLEPQRTNNIAHSEYIDSWTKSGFTGEANTSDTTSPEGLYNAYKTTATNADPYFLVIPSATFATGDVTFSMWVKGSGSAIGKSGGIYMDITFGTATGTNVFQNYTITDEWVRWEVTGTLTSGGTIRFRLEAPNGADVGDVVYVYGAQAEQGSYATSYIPTYGSAVTRNAESMSKDGLADYIGQSTGTFYIEFELPDPDTNSNAMWTGVEQGSNQGTNRALLYTSSNSNILKIDIRANGSSVGISGATITSLSADTNYKVAVRYESGNVAVYVNGVSEYTSTNTWTYSSDLTKFNFYNQSQAFQGKLKQAMLFTSSLSNQELATLTTI